MKKLSTSKLLPLSVAVLMGGESKRFGSPKAFELFHGKSLAAFLLEKASGISDDVFAVSRDLSQIPPDAQEVFPIKPDLWKEKGPLSGLHSALTHAAHSLILLRAVDMPILKREVVEKLYEIWEGEGRPDAVVPKMGGRWEPLCALWSKTALRELQPGKWNSFQRMLSESSLTVREVSEEELRNLDPDLDCLKNFNTKEEWNSFLAG